MRAAALAKLQQLIQKHKQEMSPDSLQAMVRQSVVLLQYNAALGRPTDEGEMLMRASLNLPPRTWRSENISPEEQ